MELGLPPDLADSADAETEGLRALAEGRLGHARLALLEAARVARRLAVRNELRALLGAAAAAEADGDVETARRLRSNVQRRARRLGIQSILRRVHAPLQPRQSIALTPRRRQVIELVANGVSSRGIAERLGLSPATVESHIRAVMHEVGARTRIEAAARVVGRSRRRAQLLPHEQRVVDLLATGATVTQAAILLHMSRRTMTRRLERARARVGASSNSEIVARYGSGSSGAD
jgi:DNA-binding NarL/FixJ family response regulator